LILEVLELAGSARVGVAQAAVELLDELVDHLLAHPLHWPAVSRAEMTVASQKAAPELRAVP